MILSIRHFRLLEIIYLLLSKKYLILGCDNQFIQFYALIRLINYLLQTLKLEILLKPYLNELKIKIINLEDIYFL